MKPRTLCKALLIGGFLPAVAMGQIATPKLLTKTGEPVAHSGPPVFVVETDGPVVLSAPFVHPFAYVTEFKILNVRMGDRKSALALLEAKEGPLTEEGVNHLLSTKGVKKLGAPKIVTAPAQKATVTVGKIAPQYFEKSGDHYELKQLDGDDAPGLFVDAPEDCGTRGSQAGVEQRILCDRQSRAPRI